MLERNFQPKLIKAIESKFPGCIILKNDPNYIQGIPDLTVLYKNHWALLETKRSTNAEHQANQDYYISIADGMSFARFVNPNNMEEVLDDLCRSFGS